tara:strand:- start:2 stop:214 length:213 start_codon:yes stop_codon:yes gene_type:complete
MYITNEGIFMATVLQTVEDKILELQCVRRELDEALYYDAPEYVVDRICERLNPLENEVNTLINEKDTVHA